MDTVELVRCGQVCLCVENMGEVGMMMPGNEDETSPMLAEHAIFILCVVKARKDCGSSPK